jgi:membrane-associated phospholipid phosphatase
MDNSSFESVGTDTVKIIKPNGRRISWLAWVFRLRIEEVLALLALGPMIFFTSKAYIFYLAKGQVPSLFLDDTWRVLGVIFAVAIAIILVRYKPQWRFLRLALPFSYCLAIYTNLHDTIPFVNPHDIHYTLIRIDQWMFGVQPSVWAQQFIHPWLTEIFSFCYWSYFILIPLPMVVLYFQKRYPESREALISTVLSLYVGYVLYIIFPAISPSVILKDMYTVPLTGTPLTDATMGIAGSLPTNVRDAFPSLHAGIAVLSLLFAWKYLRTMFWIILPICIGLVISTIYLRHHYVIDLPAGILLGYLAFRYGGRVDAWWRTNQSRYRI